MTNFKRMFTFVRPYMLLYCIGIFLYNFQGFAFNIAIGLMGSNVMGGILAGSTGEIVRGAVIAVSVFAVLFSFVGLGIYLGSIALLKSELGLKQVLFRCFVQSDLESSGARHSGEGIAAINTDANTAMSVWWDAFSELLSPVISVGLSLAAVLVIDWRLGLAAVVLGLVAYAMQIRFIKPLAAIGKERLEANADAVKSISDILQGALTIRAFNMQDEVLESAGKKMNRLRQLHFRQAFIAMWQRLFLTVQGWLALVIVFGFGGWLVAAHGLSFPILLLVLPLVGGISDEMGGIGKAIAGLQVPLAAAERVLAIINNAAAPSSEGNLDFDASTIHIQDLSFRYKNAGHNTLHNINLEINEGEMVAFVGTSGSGKSTLLRVISGFYERKELGLALGGILFEDANINAWRKNFAYVDQSCKLFDMTIKENIAIGRKGNSGDTDIVTAAKQAFAHDFIEQLEQKYNTPCGEFGRSLSGGQKQRIAIARALIKGASILVFDEVTSALDSNSESYVMDTIQSLRGGHTILIATHSLNTVTAADKIVVMNGGRIVEIGKHDELMAKEGLYCSLYSVNAEGV